MDAGKRNDAVEAWNKGFGSKFELPAEKPAGLPSILTRDGHAAGPWRGVTGVLSGDGGVGVSWAALELGMKVAAGPDSGPWPRGQSSARSQWCGLDVQASGLVLYIGPDDMSGLMGFMLAMEQRLTPEQAENVNDRWRYIPGADAYIGVLKASLQAMSAELDEYYGVELIILDRFAPLGDYDADGLMRDLGRMASATGAAVLVVTRDRDDIPLPVLLDGARWAAELTEIPSARGTVKLDVTKCSYGPGSRPAYLWREEWGGLRAETPGEEAQRRKLDRLAELDAERPGLVSEALERAELGGGR